MAVANDHPVASLGFKLSLSEWVVSNWCFSDFQYIQLSDTRNASNASNASHTSYSSTTSNTMNTSNEIKTSNASKTTVSQLSSYLIFQHLFILYFSYLFILGRIPVWLATQTLCVRRRTFSLEGLFKPSTGATRPSRGWAEWSWNYGSWMNKII